MRIAIASGKGGTGKTTLAVSLALVAAQEGPTVLADADVEEPNAHLFLAERLCEPVETPVEVPVPAVDTGACTGCGACQKACRFNAIAALGGGAMVFSELCHGCGGCALACPAGAIREVSRVAGEILRARTDQETLTFVRGRMRVGEAMATPLIRAVAAAAGRAGTVLLDGPPGTACPMVTAVQAADAALLVTEPTPFGLHDLGLAVETVRRLGVPFAVALNRADGADRRIQDYCAAEAVPLLGAIPDDRRVAEGYARARPLVESLPGAKTVLREILLGLRRLAGKAGGGGAEGDE